MTEDPHLRQAPLFPASTSDAASSSPLSDADAKASARGDIAAAGGGGLAGPASRETTERRPTYRRSATSGIARNDQRGWRADLAGFFDSVAQDAIERDLRVIFLIARSTDRAALHRVALALGDSRPFERVEGGPGLGSVRVPDLLEAIDAAIGDERSQERVFLDTLSAGAIDAPLVVAACHRPADPTDDGEENLAARLAERSARLVVLVEVPTGQTVLRLVDALSHASIVPWTDTWLAGFARDRHLGETELQRVVGGRLRSTARVDDASSADQEASLHVLLRRLETRDDIDGHDRIVEEIEKIVVDSAKGATNLGAEARERLLEVIRSDDAPKWGGPIGRTILLVATLVPNRSALAVLELCRWLLPPGPAHSACLTPLLRETWLREAEDDRRLGAPIRPPPGWGDLFDKTRDRIAQDIGLVVGSEQAFVPGPSLAGLDLRPRLREQSGRLTELARLVRAQASTVDLPAGLVPVVIDLALSLRRIDHGYLGAADIVALFTGMGPTDTDLAPPRTEVARMLPGVAPEILDQIRVVGDLTRLHAEALAHTKTPDGESALQDLIEALAGIGDIAERVAAEEDGLRVAAAAHLRDPLDVYTADPMVEEADLADLLDRIFARIPRASALTVLAFLVLFGPRPAPSTLGRATLRLFVGIDRATFTDTLRRFRDVFGRMMRSAVQAGDRLPPAVDAWADALWAVADEDPFRPFGRALAVWFDDALTTWEIPTDAQELLEPPLPRCLLARLGIRLPDATSEAPPPIDLLGRLFRRTPSERLDALATLAAFAGGPRGGSAPALRVEDMIAQRILDVFWVLVEEIDREEANRRSLVRDHLEQVVWSTISRHYRLSGTLDGRSVVAAILADGDDPPAAGRPDARALLDLYAPCVLMFWRFHRFGTRALTPGEDDYEEFRATLARVGDVIASKPHAERTGRALRALVDVQTQLVAHFRSRCCPRTEARHSERLACWTAVANLLAPPIATLVPNR